MKHSDSSNARILIALTLLCGMTAASCARHDEVDFSGTVVDIRSCSSLNISADRNPAHIVVLETPEGIGGHYDTLSNVVSLYEPTRHVMVGDHIHGKFYIDNDYSRTTCDWHNTDYDLPEGVFTETYVD